MWAFLCVTQALPISLVCPRGYPLVPRKLWDGALSPLVGKNKNCCSSSWLLPLHHTHPILFLLEAGAAEWSAKFHNLPLCSFQPKWRIGRDCFCGPEVPDGASISRISHPETSQPQQASWTFVWGSRTLFKLLNSVPILSCGRFWAPSTKAQPGWK